MRNVYEYMNVSSEHLGRDYQEFTFNGCTPMFSTDPIYLSRFLILESISDLQFVARVKREEPCVILCGSQDLILGDSRTLVDLLPKIRSTKIYLTDPLYQRVPSNFNIPSELEVFEFPLDPRMNAVDLANLLQNLKPHRFVSTKLTSEYNWTLSGIVVDMQFFELSYQSMKIDISSACAAVEITAQVSRNFFNLYIQLVSVIYF